MIARIAIIATLLVGLSACASSPGSQKALDDFRSRQATAAIEAEQAGRLRKALTLWQTVITVDADSADALAAIEALQGTIDDETRRAISKGEAAYSRGRTREGDRWMLRALALSPSDSRAMQALRLSSSDASHQRQDEKVESSYAGIAEEAQDEPDVAPVPVPDPVLELQRLFAAGNYETLLQVAAADPVLSEAGATWIAKAHLALAVRARKAKQPEQQLIHLDRALAAAPDSRLQKDRQVLAETLSDDYYRQSLALFKSDLEAAISALEVSIRFNPANIAATEKLDQAQTLKRNLDKIQAR